MTARTHDKHDQGATPRTDALFNGIKARRNARGFHMPEDLDDAEKSHNQLERELAEANEEIESLKLHYVGEHRDGSIAARPPEVFVSQDGCASYSKVSTLSTPATSEQCRVCGDDISRRTFCSASQCPIDWNARSTPAPYVLDSEEQAAFRKALKRSSKVVSSTAAFEVRPVPAIDSAHGDNGEPTQASEVSAIARWWADQPLYAGKKTIRRDAGLLAREVVRLSAVSATGERKP